MIPEQSTPDGGLDRPDRMLEGYRVLDLTDEKGLFCGHLLGSLGADVIKIEKPGGDPARNLGPFYKNIPHPEKSLFWLALNTNKKSVTLNIETFDGQCIFKELVEKANMVVESFSPGYLEKLGLGYPELEKINNSIILTSITPFGQTGPYRDYKASDLICWALGGALFTCGSSSGEPPMRISHIPQAFFSAGADAAWSTVIALFWAGISGEGQHVDVSIQASVENCVPNSSVAWRITGNAYQREVDGYKVLPKLAGVPQTTWEIKDGYVAYTIFTGETGAHMNAPLIEWMKSDGMADDYIIGLDWTKFEWPTASKKDIENITGLHAKFFKTKTIAEIIAEGMDKRGVPVQPMYTLEEVVNHPQLMARNYWQKLEHPELGVTITYPGGFCKPSTTTCGPIRRSPLIGEHNLEVYEKELGLSKEDIINLKQNGII